MRVPVKAASGRRDAVGRSEPTYEVDLTAREIYQAQAAIRSRMESGSVNGYEFKVLASALTMLGWAKEGRQ